ncbi:MAG: Holliday junction branch migration protein RuvA [Candidatus Babeliaceae bacterium]
MIAMLSGTVCDVYHQGVVLDVGGIGFALNVPQELAFTPGATAAFHVHMHWNQEQGPSLFGFTTLLEKKVFMQVISCSGIGPKIGLTLVANITPSQFVAAITMGDVSLLSSINGIGRKKAESIILQLKDSVNKLDITAYGEQPELLKQLKSVTDALKSLGYSRNEIEFALEKIRKEPQESTFDHLMRKVLGALAKNI